MVTFVLSVCSMSSFSHLNALQRLSLSALLRVQRLFGSEVYIFVVTAKQILIQLCSSHQFRLSDNTALIQGRRLFEYGACVCVCVCVCVREREREGKGGKRGKGGKGEKGERACVTIRK